MSKQPTDKQIIEALTRRLEQGTISKDQAFYLCDLVDKIRGENMNPVYRGSSTTGVFRRGRAEHR